MTKTTENTSSDLVRSRVLPPLGLAGTVIRWAGLVFVLLMVCPACSTEYSSVGDPIDLEAMREFKSFELTEFSSGENRRLADFLDQVTLVSFFFPT